MKNATRQTCEAYAATPERLTAALKTKHGRVKELAEYLNVKPQTLTDWMHGRSFSFIPYMSKIASFLVVSEDWLAGRTDDPMQDNIRTLELSDDELELLLSYRASNESGKALFMAVKANLANRSK